MSAVLAVLCALVAASTLVRLQVQGARIARAAHEVRGGLCVARLALAAPVPSLDAAEVQLDRATRALEDLDRAARPLEPIDLGALARLAAAGWERVSVDVPALPVRGDRALLAQAATNLIANAVEHGRPPVQVSGGLFGRTARLEVTDAGPGLPASVDALTARAGRGRRGHGLSVAAEAARRHGGRLSTAPSPAGARLVLELPVDDTAGPAIAHPRAAGEWPAVDTAGPAIAHPRAAREWPAAPAPEDLAS